MCVVMWTAVLIGPFMHSDLRAGWRECGRATKIPKGPTASLQSRIGLARDREMQVYAHRTAPLCIPSSLLLSSHLPRHSCLRRRIVAYPPLSRSICRPVCTQGGHIRASICHPPRWIKRRSFDLTSIRGRPSEGRHPSSVEGVRERCKHTLCPVPAPSEANQAQQSHYRHPHPHDGIGQVNASAGGQRKCTQLALCISDKAAGAQRITQRRFVLLAGIKHTVWNGQRRRSEHPCASERRYRISTVQLDPPLSHAPPPYRIARSHPSCRAADAGLIHIANIGHARVWPDGRQQHLDQPYVFLYAAQSIAPKYERLFFDIHRVSAA